MEVPEPSRRASPAGDQPAPAPGPPGAPGGQASPRLTLGPVILPLLEQGLAPTVFLKALPVPLYHTVPPGGLQPRAPLVTGSLEGGGVPLLLSPLLQPEGPGPPSAGKPLAPQLTVNIVGALPVLSPGLGPMLGSLGKARSAGKYLCPHCSRDCLKPSVLEKHVRSHTGERPFPCTTCGIAFKTQSNLYKHRRTQTHLNNTRLSSESDGAGGSLPEEGDKAGEAPREARRGDSGSQGGGDGAPSEKPQGTGRGPEPPAHRCPVARNPDMKLEAVPCPGSAFADREAPGDATHTAPPGFPAASSQPRRKLPEQKPPAASRPSSLPQQLPQAATWEKPWDTKAPEGRLRKCESTDSGYLSRSDSAEQPQAACSPLHSLSERSVESEGEGTPGPGGAGAEPARRGAGLELEKRRLEERIARLISHNQAVVDDPQLDNVRPRKTVLSKQGSIDLPVPYTYKDSFHFEIRAPEPGRRRHGALGSMRSACTPLDKARPLFFHSVPTQLSTTAECVPVTRSNSLPFVEGTRTWQEPPDPPDACPRRQKALSPRPAPARLVAVPSGHPRALVRQAAVEDLPCPHTGDTAAPAEGRDGKRSALGEGPAGKGRAAGRKCGQRKSKMFSQEKWQVYGNETFKRIYQKMKTSHPGGKKAREAGVGRGAEQGLPLQEEAVGGQGTPSRDGGTLVRGDTSAVATPGPRGSPPAAETFLVTEPPEPRETEARAGGRAQPRGSRAASPTTISCREHPCLDANSPLLPPNGRLEQGCPLPPAPGPLKGGALEADRPHPQLESGACRSDRVVKETCPRAQTVLRWPGCSSGEPQPTEDQLPSEKKKLRVEELSCQGPLGSLGAAAETPGGPEQAAPLPSCNQDGDPGDEPAGLRRTADCTARARAGPLGASGASPTASAAAPRPAGLGDKGPMLCPVAEAPGCCSQPVWAPGVLAALADAAFPPKYLLRLPQGETLLPLPGAQGPGQDPLCRRGGPEQPVSFAGSGLGTLLPPGPALSLAPTGAEGFGEDSSWSQLWGGGKGVQGEQNGDLDARTAADPEAPASTSGAPRATASFLCTPTCDSRRTETHSSGDPCLGSARARARPSGGVRQPWAPSREAGRPPERAPEEPPAGPAPLLSALAPAGWPEPAPCPHADTPGGFPSLRTEPQLTWCCLTRSLPLPAEQTEKAASVYSALHVPAGSPPAEGLDARPESKDVSGGWTRPRPRQGRQTQTPKLSYPTALAMPSQDWGSAPEWKRGPPRRRARTSRGSRELKKPSPHSRRYRGTFLQSRVQLRAGRLRRPLWVLRRDCHRHPPAGPDARGTLGQASSETAGLILRAEPLGVTSDTSLCCGDGEKRAEEDGRATSGTRDAAAAAVQDTPPPAGEGGDRGPQDAAVRSRAPLPPDSRVAAADDSPLSRGKGVDVESLETQLPPSREHVSAGVNAGIFSDARELSSLESEGSSPRPDAAASAAAVCTSLGAGAGPTTPGPHGTEPQGHGRMAGRALTHSPPDGRAAAEATAPPRLPRGPPPGHGTAGSVPLRSAGKPHLEIPASGSTGSHQEEGRHGAHFPSGCGEMLVPCPPLRNDSEKCQGPALLALKNCGVPRSPGQPAECPDTPLRAVKKRSLEGMRKQTRVELSDSSSDDEDRLVIEI